MSGFPDRLYKYYRLGEKSEGVFRDGTVFCASPSRFNDPFDCRVLLDPPADNDAARAALDLALREKTSLGRDKRAGLVEAALAEVGAKGDAAIETIATTLQEEVNKIGVCCLAESWDDLLMWSHYADSHRGFCVEFSTASDDFGPPFRVCYSDDAPALEWSELGKSSLIAFLTTKSKAWSYEREWRLLSVIEGEGVWHFPPGSLTAVIFGARMEAEKKASLLRCVNDSREKPTIYQATLSRRGYRVERHVVDEAGG